MTLNNPIGHLAPPPRRSMSEGELSAVDQAAATRQAANQGAGPLNMEPPAPGLQRQRSLQEQWLRRAVERLPRARGDRLTVADAPLAIEWSTRSIPLESSKTRDEILAEWDHWLSSSLQIPEMRGIVRDLLIRCLDDGGKVLNLEGLGLTSLPEYLPPSVTRLCVSRNRLSHLPQRLPSGLRQLKAAQNDLTSLPDNLPAGLAVLDVEMNRLSQLPKHLPAGLRSLIASSNTLTSLPEELPSGLKLLVLDANRLSHLPQHLPVGLRRLFVSRNCLTSLPDDLPEGLRELDVDANRLAQLPQRLPAGLRRLALSGNDLMSLPDRLPDALRELDLDGNRLTGIPHHLPQELRRLQLMNNRVARLPENITSQLSRGCHVFLSGNPLPERVRHRLYELTRARDYQGPTIYFSMGGAGPARPPARPLAEAVVAWPGVDVQSAQPHWSGFESEEGARDFSHFLDYLGETVNFQNRDFQQSVAQWLTHLQERPELRAQTFLISQGASETCEDRISLTFNRMRQARLAFDVQQGAYDQRLPELITVGRGMFRLDQLEVIAREKVKTLHFVDEIEVYLAYQVKLRQPLALPLETLDMRFFDVSYVTPADLSHAQARVDAAERVGFFDYLSCDWQPWQAVMQRLDPTGHQQASDALVEAMGEEFNHRLQVLLQREDLQGHRDAERQLGVQVKTDIAREINGRRTHEFLQSRGLLGHLQR